MLWEGSEEKKKGSSKFDSPSAASSLESSVQARVNDERARAERGIYIQGERDEGHGERERSSVMERAARPSTSKQTRVWALLKSVI